MAKSVFELEVEVPVANLQKAAKKAAEIEEDALLQLVDLYCGLRAKLDPKEDELKIEKKELTEVEEQLMLAIDNAAEGSEDGILKTAAWLLSFAAKGKQFQVEDKKKLIEIIGIDMFLSLADISVTNLRKHLTPQQLKLVGKDVHKIKRKLTYAQNTSAQS